MSNRATLSGRLPALLANAVSGAIHAATSSGMEPDEALCVSLGVIVDYGRVHYGDEYATRLPDLIKELLKEPVRGEVTYD